MKMSISDMNKKYYAVRKGFNPGIYDNWEDCKKAIHKYSSAEYKSFKNYDDAIKFLKGEEHNNNISQNDELTSYKIYCDGSCDREANIYSYGSVILNPSDEVIVRMYQGYKDNEFAQFANIAGECFGVLESLEYCKNNNISNVIIYHDYLGVKMWATGSWQTNKEISKYYADRINYYRNYVDFKFIWIKGHNKNHYNEEADQLAKMGLKTFTQSFL